MKNYHTASPVLPLLFLFVFITSCNGQQKLNSPSGNQKAIDTTAQQIDEYVVDVFEDKKGNLWFGTIYKGAACYDGKSVTYLSEKDGLCNNTVVSIAQDKDGNLWFGTHAGASRYDGKTFTSFRKTEGLHGSGCYMFVEKNGNVWAGTNDGLFRFDGSSFSEFNLPEPVIENPSYKVTRGKVWSLMEDKQGNMWFGRDGLGAVRFDGKTFTHFTTKDGLWSNNVSSIVEDKHGNIWIGTLTSDHPAFNKVGGLHRYDGKTITKFPGIKGLSENDIYSIHADKSGNVWIGATGIGVYRYDGESFTMFGETDRKDLTKYFGVQAILEDKNGTLWIGFSGGLFRFNGTSFTNVTVNGTWK